MTISECPKIGKDSRVLELTDPPKLLTLITRRIIRIVLNLLFPASDTGKWKPFSWLSSLRHPPLGIHSLSINVRLAVRTVVVEIADSITGNF